MIDFILVVREPGKLKPDYSLKFSAPTLPQEGDYVSVQRPDKPAPFGEDMIVRKVWWRLSHPETGSIASENRRGKVDEIFVECEPATGPYSSDHWLKYITATGGPKLEVERFSVREADLTKGG